MNILIVDDEVYAVRAIQRCIAWEAIGVDMVLTAFSSGQAREIFRTQTVDIVLTDIEMPGESGLELLSWIRDNEYDCIAICLTCHAEFEFAQEAMLYRVMEYVVKPVNFENLRQTIARAVELRMREKQIRVRESKGILWEYNRERLEREFWENLIDGSQEKPMQIKKRAEQINIDYDVNKQYQLILFSIDDIDGQQKEWDCQIDLMKYIIHNISRDILTEEEDLGRSGWKEFRMWVVLSEERTGELYGRVENYLEVCRNITGVEMTAYLDAPCFGEELHEVYRRLLRKEYQNILNGQNVIHCGTIRDGEEAALWRVPIEDIRIWLEEKSFIKLRKYAEFMRDGGGEPERKELFLTEECIMREIYHYLEKERISSEDFWIDELVNKAVPMRQSIRYFMEWLIMASGRLEELAADGRDWEMTAMIRKYIRENVETRITREQVAAYVNFSADYVSRRFKKETGISLSEYIMQEKIDRARQLIASGEDTIGNIAVRLGYNSFSYFSEIFRRMTGQLRQENLPFFCQNNGI